MNAVEAKCTECGEPFMWQPVTLRFCSEAHMQRYLRRMATKRLFEQENWNAR